MNLLFLPVSLNPFTPPHEQHVLKLCLAVVPLSVYTFFKPPFGVSRKIVLSHMEQFVEIKKKLI